MLHLKLTLVLGFLTAFAFSQTDTTNRPLTRFTYPNGKISSEGYMIEGKADGYWKTFYENGNIKSEGNRKNFELDSAWKFYNEDGQLVLEMNYRKGKKNGLKKTYREGEMVTENFVNDIKSGLTTLYYPDGKIKSTVNFVNGVEQGYAKEYDKNGNIISLIEYKKGFVISREFINRFDKEGKKSGSWKTFWDNGNLKTEAYYKNDLLNGYYKEYGLDGKLTKLSKYADGELLNDAEEVVKLDERTDYYPDGKKKITANFKNNVPEGVRREYDKDGKIVKGLLYKKGVIIGEGITDEAGLKQGKWKEFFEDGKLKSEGSYVNDKPVGKWNYFYNNSKLEQEGIYSKTGKPEGLWKWYFDNGSIRREESFTNGKSDGPMVEYDENGKIVVQGEYTDGNEQGKWLYQMGDYKEEGSYVDGLRDGLWKSYYADGTLAFEGRYVEEVPDGKHVYYWENGLKKDEGFYVMGKKQGDWVKYNIDGTMFLIITYKDGLEKRYDGVKIVPEPVDEE